jgi:hypothetical protein
MVTMFCRVSIAEGVNNKFAYWCIPYDSWLVAWVEPVNSMCIVVYYFFDFHYSIPDPSSLFFLP